MLCKLAIVAAMSAQINRVLFELEHEKRSYPDIGLGVINRLLYGMSSLSLLLLIGRTCVFLKVITA